ncbi:hypothetical protein ACIBEJ_18335 [Nonomuraea sp. NPDC050790]|uniref:hypothetical protein n=1 Tax=Nonomuraea sp. NPDC050790 TaxID=3364371 RepID=UPI0037A9F270
MRDSLDVTDVTTALSTALDAVGGDIAYRLCGTGAALHQGVPLPVGDIDILLSGRDDVDRFASALTAFPCLYKASWLADTSQYFTRFSVGGVDFELSTLERHAVSDAMECVGSGPWQHYVLVSCGAHEVPVVRLELRLASELLRDRPDRYGPILDHLSTYGFDADLLRRALAAHDIPARHRRLVRERLP